MAERTKKKKKTRVDQVREGGCSLRLLHLRWGIVPLLGASFIRNYKVRVGVVVGVVSVALVVFAWLGAALGKAPLARSIVRVLIGGWLAMAITFGLTKLVGSSGL
ncbi:hypothetical protein LOK49_LG08G01376 [Camellia lanceoleosa]|uniref:Uncharacterized protein n=1 Tax=Camellia lanceoleosa TaxID=1840588 RepID=A0ACC0GRH2_9ERIC|nr:hypothetical protein LOK49_LG08G01376 [Camellia lanceoleosa]